MNGILKNTQNLQDSYVRFFNKKNFRYNEFRWIFPDPRSMIKDYADAIADICPAGNVCSQCWYGCKVHRFFSTQNGFKEHTKVKHPAVSYACGFCNGDYGRKRERLEKHLNSDHPLEKAVAVNVVTARAVRQYQ